MKSITVLLYDFYLRMKILLLTLLLFKANSAFNLRHLRTFSQVLKTVIKIFNVFLCIFKCLLILLMRNIKCYHKTVFIVDYSNKNK